MTPTGLRAESGLRSRAKPRSARKAERGAARRILITGGAGFFGGNAALRMIEDGGHVSIPCKLSRPGTERNLKWLITEHPADATFIKEDVRNASALNEHVKGQDAILHLAGQVAVTTSLADPSTDFDINAGGTLNLLEATRKHNPEVPFVFASTNKVYGKLENNSVACKESRSEERRVGKECRSRWSP